MVARCRKCLLSEKVPGACLDTNGVCGPCRSYAQTNFSEKESERKARETDLENALRDCRGKGEYDCILCLSGGKDSLYLLYKLVRDYKLKVLAYTSQFDIPETALDNIRRTVKKLGVTHLVDTPSEAFYKKFIRYLVRNQDKTGAVHTVCYFWLDIREGNVLKVAVEKKIPLILAGYAPGQPDPERMIYEMPQKRIREDWTPRHFFDSGLFEKSELSHFWNPSVYPSDTKFPRLLAPFHAWLYDQSEIMKKVVAWGLAKNKASAHPILSNFTLNWLFMYSDLKNLGYNPYLPEFAQLIREGRASRTAWEILGPLVDFMILHKIFLGRHVKKGLKWLDIKEEEMRIRAEEKP